MAAHAGLFRADDGLTRCAWCRASERYSDNHDHEWGRPRHRADVARLLANAGIVRLGLTTVYAFMPVMGRVDGHFEGCHARAAG